MFKHCMRSMLKRSMSSNAIPPWISSFVEEKLPDLPQIEVISISNSMEHNDAHVSIRKVKYGDFEFMECKEGYILCYIQAYLKRKEPQDAFYGVYYGIKSPLNSSGPVNGFQTLEIARQTAVLRLIEGFPNIEAKKLCICSDCSHTLKMMGRLQDYSENGFRSISKGSILRNKSTCEELNRILRLRNDIQIRMLYTPTAIAWHMKEAQKLAMLASGRM